MMAFEQCPGPALCPLYVLSHDASTARLGCVRDMAEPCDGAEPEAFQRLLEQATSSIFEGLRARILRGAC
jgi:hypothetical protein